VLMREVQIFMFVLVVVIVKNKYLLTLFKIIFDNKII